MGWHTIHVKGDGTLRFALLLVPIACGGHRAGFESCGAVLLSAYRGMFVSLSLLRSDTFLVAMSVRAFCFSLHARACLVWLAACCVLVMCVDVCMCVCVV
jgi:hypothetical protein